MSIDFCQRCNKRLDTDFLEYQPDGSLYCGACEADIEEEKHQEPDWKPLAGELAEASAGIAELYAGAGENINDSFERVSGLFRRDTGYIAPGKDCRIHDYGTRALAWTAWMEGRIEKLRAALAKYEQEQEKGA